MATHAFIIGSQNITSYFTLLTFYVKEIFVITTMNVTILITNLTINLQELFVSKTVIKISKFKFNAMLY